MSSSRHRSLHADRDRHHTHNDLGQEQRKSGTTLFVRGMASVRAARDGCTSAFKSSAAVGDAHIKELNYMTVGTLSAPVSTLTPRKSPSESRHGSAAFACKIDDRYSYLPRPHTPSFQMSTSPFVDCNSNVTPRRSSPGRAATPTSSSSSKKKIASPSAVFRSKTPIACAHQVEVARQFAHDRGSLAQSPAGAFDSIRRGTRGTSSFCSSANRDSYIKALPAVLDTYSPLRSDFDRSSPSSSRWRSREQPTSSFASKTSIADAHIRALVPPMDINVAYTSS